MGKIRFEDTKSSMEQRLAKLSSGIPNSNYPGGLAVVGDPRGDAVMGDTVGNQFGIFPFETKIDSFIDLKWNHFPDGGGDGDGELDNNIYNYDNNDDDGNNNSGLNWNHCLDGRRDWGKEWDDDDDEEDDDNNSKDEDDNDDGKDSNNNDPRKKNNGPMDAENSMLASLKYSIINSGTATSALAPTTKELLSLGFGFGVSLSGKEIKSDPVSATGSCAGRFSFNGPGGGETGQGYIFPQICFRRSTDSSSCNRKLKEIFDIGEEGNYVGVQDKGRKFVVNALSCISFCYTWVLVHHRRSKISHFND